MSAILEHLVIGLAVGSVYAVIALGFVLIYKGTGIFNLAQGSLMALGAFICYFFTDQIGIPFGISVLLTLVASFGVGLLIEFIFLRRLIGQSLLSILMVTIGILLIVRGVILTVWGVYGKAFPSFLPPTPIVIFGASIQPIFLLATVAAIVLFTIFILFFKYTSVGVAMRATQDNQQVAQSVGISVKQVYGLSWGIASLTAAIAGVIVGTILSVSYQLDEYGLVAMPAIILGGLESIPGALIGGLFLGVMEHFGSAYLGSVLIGIETVLPYVILLIILLIRPYGIFGEKRIERV
jgi:branched-chain amino acid transport system permease protein